MSKKTQQRIEMLSFNYPYEKVRNGVWGDKAAHKPIKEIFHKLLIMEVLPDQDEDAVTTSMKEQKKKLMGNNGRIFRHYGRMQQNYARSTIPLQNARKNPTRINQN